MKHIYFAYPAGRVGIALLLLRISLVLWLPSALIALVSTSRILVAVTVCLVMICLGLGFATRLAAGACGIGLALMIWPVGALAPLDLGHVLVAASLALIGPGAVSVDALLFGRRTMRLPE